MKPALWVMLYELSNIGAHSRHVKLSTTGLARSMGLSQQTASRHLIELERGGYIVKKHSLQGVDVEITESGLNELRRVYSQLKPVFEERSNMISLEGKVFSGLGEGGYYISMKGYKHQFLLKLGFNPYPGTLNIKLDSPNIEARRQLEMYPPVTVEGFESRRRTFGQVKCYPVTINDEVEGAIIIINRTHYDASVLELIAPMNLRQKLSLKDGSGIHIKAITANLQ
jgi:riboflavin kinase, archaea type